MEAQGSKLKMAKCHTMLEAKKASHAALMLKPKLLPLCCGQAASSKLLRLDVSVLSTNCLCKLLLLRSGELRVEAAKVVCKLKLQVQW